MGDIQFDQQYYISQAFTYLTFTRMKIHGYGNNGADQGRIELLHGPGQYISLGTGEDVTAPYASEVRQLRSFSRKLYSQRTISGTTSMLQVSIKQYGSVWCRVITEGAWNSESSIHVAEFLISHNNGNEPEPSDGGYNGVINENYHIRANQTTSDATKYTYTINTYPSVSGATSSAKTFTVYYTPVDSSGSSVSSMNMNVIATCEGGGYDSFSAPGMTVSIPT